jgi:hypothetical protein
VPSRRGLACFATSPYFDLHNKLNPVNISSLSRAYRRITCIDAGITWHSSFLPVLGRPFADSWIQS